MRSIAKLAVLLAASGCSSDSEPPSSGPLEEGPPIKVVREVAVAFHDDGGEFLFHPTDLVLVGDSLIVVDNGNDRLVILDTA
jgi:hypothetical protein